MTERCSAAGRASRSPAAKASALALFSEAAKLRHPASDEMLSMLLSFLSGPRRVVGHFGVVISGCAGDAVVLEARMYACAVRQHIGLQVLPLGPAVLAEVVADIAIILAIVGHCSGTRLRRSIPGRRLRGPEQRRRRRSAYAAAYPSFPSYSRCPQMQFPSYWSYSSLCPPRPAPAFSSCPPAASTACACAWASTTK